MWGKTELFRNQDQFNPQDVALASLPSLEESRIALWSLRGVWSFYDVGLLEDVRLELAANYDQFEPTDIGRCGEPYSPLPVCDKTYGLFIHELTGLGVGGEVRPDNPWSDQVTGLQRNTLWAGGGERFGRRDFVWQSGSPLALRYDKRNVLGFSTDFAEDRTKSSWGVEFTWVEGVTFADLDEPDRTREGQTFNTTISVDRPTFINFLNANRTFFINSQWFVQWVDGYRESFPSDGPWNVLATLTVQTGFFRDRFQPNMTFVYDFGSNSGAWLPSVTYRENGLSVVRERNELFLRVRYTF